MTATRDEGATELGNENLPQTHDSPPGMVTHASTSTAVYVHMQLDVVQLIREDSIHISDPIEEKMASEKFPFSSKYPLSQSYSVRTVAPTVGQVLGLPL